MFHNECVYFLLHTATALKDPLIKHSQLVFSQTSQLFLSIFSVWKASVCLGASENTTIMSTFQFVSSKHTFECTTRRLLDELICMNLLLPSEVRWVAVGLSDRLHAAKIYHFPPEGISVCTATLFFTNSLRFGTRRSFSVIQPAFPRRRQYVIV